MPPPMLLCVLGGQVTGERRPLAVLRESFWPIVGVELVGILLIIFSREVGALLQMN